MKSIAVIGAGYWGKNLVRNYFEEGALHSVCDARREILSAIKKHYPDVVYTEHFDDVLADTAVKGVVIALPAECHYEYAAKALNAGKDVFVEKPLALDLDHARKLTAMALERRRILMVGHLLRYHPAFLTLKELTDRGELGRLQYIYSTRLSLGKIRREENALWSFAPHDISMILALCNEMPQHVSAVGHNYLHKQLADVTTTHLSFPSGVNGHIFVSWLHPFKEQKLVVIGEAKMAVNPVTSHRIRTIPSPMKRSLAARVTAWPPWTEPVKATKSTCGWAISVSVSAWLRCRIWNTPAGRPAAAKPSRKASATSGVWCECLRITALPASSAGTIAFTAVR